MRGTVVVLKHKLVPHKGRELVTYTVVTYPFRDKFVGPPPTQARYKLEPKMATVTVTNKKVIQTKMVNKF